MAHPITPWKTPTSNDEDGLQKPCADRQAAAMQWEQSTEVHVAAAAAGLASHCEHGSTHYRVFFSSDTPLCHSGTSAADREVAQNQAVSICTSLGALNHTQPRTQKRAGAGEFFLSVPLPDLCCLYPQLHPAGKPMPIPFPHPHSWNISPEPSPALGVPGKVLLLLKQRRANSRGAVVFSPAVWD